MSQDPHTLAQPLLDSLPARYKSAQHLLPSSSLLVASQHLLIFELQLVDLRLNFGVSEVLAKQPVENPDGSLKNTCL